MSRLEDSSESKALFRFWEENLGGVGTLITEYTVVSSRRRIDGVVIPDEKPDGTRIDGRTTPVPLEGKDVILIEVKKRLGRSLSGQAFFAIGLVAPLKPSSVRSIALCNTDDPDLRRLLMDHKVEVERIDPWPEGR
jgi:hypothetical protein